METPRRFITARLFCCVLALIVCYLTASAFAAATVTRTQAIAIVRSIINRNATGCRISKTTSITATQVKTGWRVMAKVVMSAGGTSRNEILVWTVGSGEAVRASQPRSEVENGCR